MITKLSAEQIKRFPEFIDKWTNIGLSTQPANRKEAERGIVESYRIAGLEPPRIVWCGSPLSQGLTRSIVSSFSDNVVANVMDNVMDSVMDSVRDSVWASVVANVGASVGASVRDSVYGQHESAWIGFYDFLKIVCELVNETEKLKGIATICENAGWWLPHEKLCWICERHDSLHRNSIGRLHKDESPALTYPDGWQLFYLNGISMKPDQVLTPAERITPESVLQEDNIDRRRELIRKVGIERMLAQLPHKLIEKRGDYELLSIHLSEQVTDARYLRMLNQSIGVWHLEGVDPSCKTVTESLNWRNSNWHENAEILT